MKRPRFMIKKTSFTLMPGIIQNNIGILCIYKRYIQKIKHKGSLQTAVRVNGGGINREDEKRREEKRKRASLGIDFKARMTRGFSRVIRRPA